MPELGSVESYREYIDKKLPIDKDDPDVFGMHENANITFQSQESDKMLSTILSIQPRTAGASGGSSKSAEEVITEIIDGIYLDLPPPLRKEDGEKMLFVEN